MAGGGGGTEEISCLKLSPAVMIQKVLRDRRWQIELFNSRKSLFPNCLPYHTSTQIH